MLFVGPLCLSGQLPEIYSQRMSQLRGYQLAAVLQHRPEIPITPAHIARMSADDYHSLLDARYPERRKAARMRRTLASIAVWLALAAFVALAYSIRTDIIHWKQEHDHGA